MRSSLPSAGLQFQGGWWDRKVRWKGKRSPPLHSLTYWGESVILSSGPWLRNSGPESSHGKGTEQEVRGKFPTVAGSSPYCTVRNSRENESAVCRYISHMRCKRPKAVITYSLLSTVVRSDEAGLLLSSWAHSGLPTARGPAGTGCPDGPHFHCGLSQDGWRTRGVLVSLPTWSQAADSSVVREGVCDGVISELRSPKRLESTVSKEKGEGLVRGRETIHKRD